MLEVPTLPLTADYYRNLPEGGPRFQLIDGQMHMSPSPNRYHQQIVLNLSSILHRAAKRAGGDLYFAPLDVFLSDHDVFQPDVIYVSKNRSSVLVEEGILGAPDLVCEVLSPSTRLMDLGAKREAYVRSGVLEMWVVDPNEQTVAVYRLQKNPQHPQRVYRAGESFKSACFRGLVIRVNAILKP